MIPLWVGSRCWTITKAMPLFTGTFCTNCSKASSPPAKALVPTMGSRNACGPGIAAGGALFRFTFGFGFLRHYIVYYRPPKPGNRREPSQIIFRSDSRSSEASRATTVNRSNEVFHQPLSCQQYSFLETADVVVATLFKVNRWTLIPNKLWAIPSCNSWLICFNSLTIREIIRWVRSLQFFLQAMRFLEEFLRNLRQFS